MRQIFFLQNQNLCCHFFSWMNLIGLGGKWSENCWESRNRFNIILEAFFFKENYTEFIWMSDSLIDINKSIFPHICSFSNWVLCLKQKNSMSKERVNIWRQYHFKALLDNFSNQFFYNRPLIWKYWNKDTLKFL